MCLLVPSRSRPLWTGPEYSLEPDQTDRLKDRQTDREVVSYRTHVTVFKETDSETERQIICGEQFI